MNPLCISMTRISRIDINRSVLAVESNCWCVLFSWTSYLKRFILSSIVAPDVRSTASASSNQPGVSSGSGSADCGLLRFLICSSHQVVLLKLLIEVI